MVVGDDEWLWTGLTALLLVPLEASEVWGVKLIVLLEEC